MPALEVHTGLQRALKLVRNALRSAPRPASIACSSCGEPAAEGIGDPEVERICIACAVMLRVQCTDGDSKACAHLEALNALPSRSQRGGAG